MWENIPIIILLNNGDAGRTSRGLSREFDFGVAITNLYVQKCSNIDLISDEASGSSIDWAYGTQNVSLAYVFELRGPPGGLGSGFLLPSDQILPNGLEFVEGLTAMVQQAQALNYL